MNICEGCKQGLENQMGHIGGCLKDENEENEKYTCTIYLGKEFITYNIFEQSFASGINESKRYAAFTVLFEVINECSQYHDDIVVITTDKKMYDILSGKCYGKVSYYTFYLKFKTFKTSLKYEETI